MRKVAQLPPPGENYAPHIQPSILDARPLTEIDRVYGAIEEHWAQVRDLAHRFPTYWIRAMEWPARSLAVNQAGRITRVYGLVTEVKTNENGVSWLYLKVKRGRTESLRAQGRKLPAPPMPFPWPVLDTSDGGFCWTQDELDECVRLMREQLFPVDELEEGKEEK